MPACLPHFSCALQIGMRILWGEGVVLPCGGVGEWVASGNKELTEEGVFVFFLSVWLYVWCIHWGESSAKLSIQVSKLKFVLFYN